MCVCVVLCSRQRAYSHIRRVPGEPSHEDAEEVADEEEEVGIAGPHNLFTQTYNQHYSYIGIYIYYAHKGGIADENCRASDDDGSISHSSCCCLCFSMRSACRPL